MISVWFLLRRYLFPRRGNLLSFALWLSVAGVSLGIIQLMLVLSVMSGFQTLFQKNYTRITSELLVLPRNSQGYRDSFHLQLEGIAGLQAVTPFNVAQGMILKNGVGGVTLEGLDPATAGKVTPWNEVWVEKPLLEVQQKNPYWIWLGKQLADKLHVHRGDTVRLLLADARGKEVIPFVVTAITKFGIYDHDMRWARMDIKVLNELLQISDVEPMYKCNLLPGMNLDDMVAKVRETMGTSVNVKRWSDINQNIFLAVQHQKKLLFLVLEIIVGLAAMNVVNLLLMTSYQRRRDVAILRAMGMRLYQIFWFFVLQGLAVGVVGIVLGIGLGVVTCHIVERYQPAILSEAIYNVTRLPIRVEWLDVTWVAVVAFFLCLVFSILPAWRAALARPVNALRYE